jgi:hypothetical protein
VPNGFREIHELIVERPFRHPVGQRQTEGEVGRLARLDRRRDLAGMLRLWIEGDLHLLTGLVLEGSDHLGNRVVLLGIKPLLSPHHEVGALSAERYKHQQGGKYGAGNPHHVKSSHRQLAGPADHP